MAFEKSEFLKIQFVNSTPIKLLPCKLTFSNIQSLNSIFDILNVSLISLQLARFHIF